MRHGILVLENCLLLVSLQVVALKDYAVVLGDE